MSEESTKIKAEIRSKIGQSLAGFSLTEDQIRAILAMVEAGISTVVEKTPTSVDNFVWDLAVPRLYLLENMIVEAVMNLMTENGVIIAPPPP